MKPKKRMGSTAKPDNQMKFWDERAKLLKVLSHPVRLLILSELSNSSLCVKDINSLVGIKQPNLSQHIALLRKTKLVGCHTSGSLRCYYIQQPSLVKQLIRLLSLEHEVVTRKRDSVVQEAKTHSLAGKK